VLLRCVRDVRVQTQALVLSELDQLRAQTVRDADALETVHQENRALAAQVKVRCALTAWV
jgi:hypothetical protein